MTIKIWKEFTQKGYITVPYTFTKSIGAINSIVLGQIISEYNHANNKKFAYKNYFLSNIKRFGQHVGIEENLLFEAFEYLCSLNFINFYNTCIENTVLFCIYEDNIIEFKSDKENEYYQPWDYGLIQCQNPQSKIKKLSSAIFYLQSLIDELLGEVNALPAVFYVCCYELIIKHEQDALEKIYSQNLKNEIIDIVNSGGSHIKEYIADFVLQYLCFE